MKKLFIAFVLVGSCAAAAENGMAVMNTDDAATTSLSLSQTPPDISDNTNSSNNLTATSLLETSTPSDATSNYSAEQSSRAETNDVNVPADTNDPGDSTPAQSIIDQVILSSDSDTDPTTMLNTADAIAATEPPQPTCATSVFANALAATANTVSESDPGHIIQAWIYKVFQDPKNIKQVLACPEISGVADKETIKFLPIEYSFPGGRQIAINYATQPDILKQRLAVAGKKSLPETNPSPRVGAPGDPAVWTNTDPAWYGILVVQSGSMDEFIGPDKNNTISLKYLEQNIDRFYPTGTQCTSKSALASDDDMINIAAHKTVGLKDDTNDYYVAGDANLQWITWAEVALDVAITVATVGGGTVVLGMTKGVRASKAAKNVISVVRDLEKIDTVQDYIKLTRQSAAAADELKKINRTADAAAYAAKSDEIKRLGDGIKDLEKLDDVRKYKTAATSLDDVMKYRHALKAWKIPQRGNVISRAWRSLRAINTGNKTINRAAKAGRAGMKSGKIRDWLFQSTLRNAGKLAKIEAAGGMIYGTMKFVGDMYDWSETATGDFTNGLQFKPLGLLSADDLAGQENIVNHGMWFMWAGDSLNPVDDDAAYLLAMDTAVKFAQDLEETQDDLKASPCSVDIFVVRPILRNPGEDDAELYYLIMNDKPWRVTPD